MTARRNPFVGPRPLKLEDPLFGRDQELEDIKSLLISGRILLLYSVSGAGKTSLIQAGGVGGDKQVEHAGLAKQMDDEGFQVLPLLRVYPQAGISGTETGGNPYLGTVLKHLAEIDTAWSAPAAGFAPSLADLSRLRGGLAEYLSVMPSIALDERPKLLIFDQFEEILTHDPADTELKELFFRQLGTALRDRNLWALFAIREEYIGGFDPYLHYLPTRLATRYRLTPLPRKRAEETVIAIAQKGGATFDQDSAERLIENLASYRPRGVAGAKRRPLPYVEPLHLQIVCRQLWWKQIKQGKRDSIVVEPSIDPAVDVNSALSDYFSGTLRRIAGDAELKTAGVDEKRLRLWFHRYLYTPDGIRRQIRRDPDATEGLPELAVAALEHDRLLKSDERGGVVWVELSHDRLLEPVMEDNANWFARRLVPFQRNALHWKAEEDVGQKKHWLLIGNHLKEARDWIADTQYVLDDPVEQQFLDACGIAERNRQDTERAENQARRKQVLINRLGVAAGLGLAGTLILSAYLYHYAGELETAQETLNRTVDELRTGEDKLKNKIDELRRTEKDLNRTVDQRKDALKKLHSSEEDALQQKKSFRVLALNSRAAREKWIQHNHEIATLLAIQGLRFNDQLGLDERGKPKGASNEALITGALLMALDGLIPGHDFSHQVRAATVTADRSPVLLCNRGFGVRDGSALRVRLFGRQPPPDLVFENVAGEVLSLSADCRRLVAVDEGTLHLHEVDGRTSALGGSRDPGPFVFADLAVAGPDAEGSVGVWRDGEDGHTTRIQVTPSDGDLASLALSPGADLVALGAGDGRVLVRSLDWESGTSRNLCNLPLSDRGPTQLVTQARSRIVGLDLVDLDRQRLLVVAQGGGNLTIVSVAGKSCKKIARGSVDLKRDSDTLSRVERRRLLTSAVQVDSGDSALRLALGGTEGYLVELQWRPGLNASHQIDTKRPRRLKGQRGDVVGLRFGPDSDHLAVTDELGEVRVWDLEGLNSMAMRRIPTKTSKEDQVFAIVAAGGQQSQGRVYVSRRLSGLMSGTPASMSNGQVPTLDLKSDADFGSGARAMLSFVVDGDAYVVVPARTSLRLIGVGETDDLVAEIDAGGDIRAMAADVDQGLFVYGTNDGTIRVSRLITNDGVRFEEISALKNVPGAPLRALAIHPQRRLLVAGFRGSNDAQNLFVWDLSAEGEPIPLVGHDGPVQALRFQHEKPYRLASGGEDSRIHLWDFKDGIPQGPAATLIGHVGSVNALAFRPSRSDTLASSGNDGVIRLWDLSVSLNGEGRSPDPILLDGGSSELLSLTFLDDDQVLAAGDAKGNLYLWRADKDSLIDAACNALWRNLSCDEWKRFVGDGEPRQTCPALPRGHDCTDPTDTGQQSPVVSRAP